MAEMGITSIKKLIADSGSKFNADMWTVVCRILVRVFEQSAGNPFADADVEGHDLQESAHRRPSSSGGADMEEKLKVMGQVEIPNQSSFSKLTT